MGQGGASLCTGLQAMESLLCIIRHIEPFSVVLCNILSMKVDILSLKTVIFKLI